MKRSNPDSFFSPPPEAKHRRIEPPAPPPITIIPKKETILDMPHEMWVVILSYLNKKELREASQADAYFRELVGRYTLFEKAPFPPIDYTNRLDKKFSSTNFNIAYEEALDMRCLFPLKNGDALAGLTDGKIYVLELGQSEWHLYGQHERSLSSIGLRTSTVHNARLLPSGIIATCGDDGVRLWNRKARQLIQLLQLPGRGWATKTDGIQELENGDLIISAKDNHFHYWKKMTSNNSYQYIKKLFGAKGDSVKTPYVWMKTNDGVMGCGNKFISRWYFNSDNMQSIEISVIKNRLVQAMRQLRRDANFIATYLNAEKLTLFDLAIAQPNDYEFIFCWDDTPTTFLDNDCAIVRLHDFTFIIKLFDPAITPHFLGTVDDAYSIESSQDNIATIHFSNRDSTLTLNANWNCATNFFQHISTWTDMKFAHLLSTNLILIEPKNGIPFIYNVEKNASYELPLEELTDDHSLTLLKNGDILGKSTTEGHFHFTQLTIWDRQTGATKNNLLALSDDVTELENGDLMIMSHSADEETQQVQVFRFGVMK